MINWIKYSPLALRDRGDCVDFSGPKFTNSKRFVINAGGNKISFCAPRHRQSNGEKSFHLKNKEVLSTHFECYPSDIVANHNWLFNVVFSRAWDYYFPWFRGTAGMLSLAVVIIKRHEGKEFNGASFFHPRSFEYALTNYLNVLYGTRADDDSYRAPLSWATHDHLPVVSASFNVESLNKKLIFSFPVDDKHIANFSFRYIGYSSAAEEEHMKKLAQDIIASVKMELTPETQARINAVAAECGDMRLTESFPPLKWPIKAEDIEAPRNDQPLPKSLGLFGMDD